MKIFQRLSVFVSANSINSPLCRKKKQHEKTGQSVENECNLAQYKQFVNCLCVNRSKTFWIQSNRVNFGYKLLKLFQNLKLTLKIGRKLGFIDQQSIQADTTSQRYGWAQDKLGWGFRVQSAVMEAYEIYKWQKRRQSPGGSGQISLNKNIYCHVYLIVSLHFFALLLSGNMLYRKYNRIHACLYAKFV